MNVIRIATININAIQNETRVGMFKEFIRANDLDIVLIQEVATPNSIETPGYVAYENIGPDMRGTAIVARRNIQITNIEKLPSGRAMAVESNGLRIINIYAPSGTAKRTERERFYNSELPVLLTAPPTQTLIGGDFNCILSPSDATGNFTHSNALANVIRGFNLTDAWKQDPLRPAYTHHSNQGASRIDRFYLSPAAEGRKVGIETIPVAFTDHHAVLIRMRLYANERRRRNGRWRMDSMMVSGTQFTDALQSEWKKWTDRKRYYPDIGSWWERCVKANVRKLARQVETEKIRTYKLMEEHLYQCMQDIIKTNIPEAEKHLALHKYKAKLVRLYAQKRETLLLDTQPKDRMENESLSLYQLVKINKRRADREITQIQDVQGNRHTTFQGIAATLVQHYAKTFQPIPADNNAIQMLKKHISVVDHQKYKTHLEQPITTEELYQAISAGSRKKTPGIDGICLEFYATHWQIIKTEMTHLINNMFLNKAITEKQKRGILLCIPKHPHAEKLEDYRPISLLTTEYKLLARIMANRLRPLIQEQITTGQYCGVPRRTIIDALTTIRDMTAYHEMTHTPLCMLSLDFQKAFDQISHEYLYQILESYGVSRWFVERVRAMYENMSSMVQVNGAMVGPIKIESGIRQGCPLSMALYTLCLHPLLRHLEERLPRVTIGRKTVTTTVVAYADDVTVFLKDATGFQKVQEALQLYKRASGAKINLQKSAALAIAGWTAPTTPLGIAFKDRVDILGINFHPILAQTRDDNWTRTVRTVRAQARKAYARTLCLDLRIQYTTLYLLAKIWYIAQVLPLKKSHAQQLTTIVQWFIWQAAIFRVPAAITQRPKKEGGWNMPDIDAKCKTLLYNRMRDTIEKGDTILACMYRTWGMHQLIKNPPAANRHLKKLEHLQNYVVDMAYMSTTDLTGSCKIIKKSMYATLHHIATNGNPMQMRIIRHNPGIAWQRVWSNLHNSGLPPDITSMWYKAINDILPTHNRLVTIHLVPDNKCPRCQNPDSILHRIVECNDGTLQWGWTKQKLALILRTEPKHIPKEWTILPDFHIWPPQRHAAVTWMIANLVYYRLQNNRRLSLRDYIDYMKRARWKHTRNKAASNTGRYLDVIEWTYP